MKQPTNNQRASWANTALSAYINEVGYRGGDAAALLELLTDFMHFCDAQGEQRFADLVVGAEVLYEAHTTLQPKADYRAFGDDEEEEQVSDR